VINVAIAIIKKDQRLLITQRGPHTHLPGLWEFPGGKQRPEETLEECLIREIGEELQVEIEIRRPYGQIRHSYPDREVMLHVYLCCLHGTPPMLSEQRKWVAPHELSLYTFPAANDPLILALSQGKVLWE
jgi:mutator protein MutT